MKKLAVPMILLVAFVCGSALALSACKQNEGERCQIDDDCKSNICNQATHTCADPNTDMEPIDTLPPLDGPPDAPPDAPDAA